MSATATPIKELQKGRPGERFQRLYRQRQDSRHGPAKNAAFFAMGVLTIALGILTYPIPVIPSDLVILVGFALLAQGSRRGARGLDWLEVRFRRRFSDQIKTWKRLSRAAKVFVSVAWTSVVSTLFYIAYRVAASFI